MLPWSFSPRDIRRALLLAVLVWCGIFLLPQAAYAADADFETDAYNVTINVQGDNSAYITEEIAIDALQPIHGIYRYIPLSQTIRFYDKEEREIDRARKNIRVEEITVEKDPFEAYKKNGNRIIKIGDEDKTFKGEHDYTLSYRVRLYDDGIKDYDVFYYNVLPNDWETPIKVGTVTLNMPAGFAKKDVHVLVGRKGKDYEDKYVDWSVEGNTLTITLEKELPQGSYLTVGILLPEGYFENELSDRKTYLLLYGLAVFGGILMVYQWWKRGRDPQAVKTVEFYPPEEMTPAEVGYVIDGKVDREDVTSLVIYFANKGYLSIEETAKDRFVLHRLRALPPDAKSYEKIFFDALFKDGDEAALDDLPEGVYAAFSATKEAVRMEFQSKDTRIFSKTASKERILCIVLSLLLVAVGGGILLQLVGSYFILIPVAACVALLLVSFVFAVRAEDRRYVLKKGGKFGTTMLSLAFLGGAMVGTYLYMTLSVGSKKGAFAYIFLEACGYFAVRYMRARTKRGAELLGRLLGFKEFISVAELDKLEMMVEEDPNYFYDILPYAHVLGLSKKWAKKFETIATKTPEWYAGDYGGSVGFNTWVFYRSFHGCMSAVSSHIATPSGAGGSGGSMAGSAGGGGFTGGGGLGGGGGGSW